MKKIQKILKLANYYEILVAEAPLSIRPGTIRRAPVEPIPFSNIRRLGPEPTRVVEPFVEPTLSPRSPTTSGPITIETINQLENSFRERANAAETFMEANRQRMSELDQLTDPSIGIKDPAARQAAIDEYVGLRDEMSNLIDKAREAQQELNSAKQQLQAEMSEQAPPTAAEAPAPEATEQAARPTREVPEPVTREPEPVSSTPSSRRRKWLEETPERGAVDGSYGVLPDIQITEINSSILDRALNKAKEKFEISKANYIAEAIKYGNSTKGRFQRKARSLEDFTANERSQIEQRMARSQDGMALNKAKADLEALEKLEADLKSSEGASHELLKELIYDRKLLPEEIIPDPMASIEPKVEAPETPLETPETPAEAAPPTTPPLEISPEPTPEALGPDPLKQIKINPRTGKVTVPREWFDRKGKLKKGDPEIPSEKEIREYSAEIYSEWRGQVKARQQARVEQRSQAKSIADFENSLQASVIKAFERSTLTGAAKNMAIKGSLVLSGVALLAYLFSGKKPTTRDRKEKGQVADSAIKEAESLRSQVKDVSSLVAKINSLTQALQALKPNVSKKANQTLDIFISRNDDIVTAMEKINVTVDLDNIDSARTYLSNIAALQDKIQTYPDRLDRLTGALKQMNRNTIADISNDVASSLRTYVSVIQKSRRLAGSSK